MNSKNKRGIEAHDFDTSDKTIMKTHPGFANSSLAQRSENRIRNVACGMCGAKGLRLYSGGTRRSLSLCADCLWPSQTPESTVAAVPHERAVDDLDRVRKIRLVPCYVCERPRPHAAMSIVPVICRDCLTNDGSRHAKRRIEKAILRINRAIRRAACI